MKIKTTSPVAVAFLIFFWLGINNVYAGFGTYTGQVTQVLSGPGFGTMVVIAVAGGPSSVTDKATCSTDGIYSFVFDASDISGKNTLALVVTAYATGKTVYLRGNSGCPPYWGVEQLGQIKLQ